MLDIDTRALKQKLDANEDFLLLNVLPEETFRKEHIPKSENIPAGKENSLEIKAGYINVKKYEGGMSIWEQDHYAFAA